MTKPNFKKVLDVLEKHYVLVPLEVFGTDPYKTLISTVLSARTNDDTTLMRSKALFEAAPDIFSLDRFSEPEIAKIIYPVGFYKTKAKHLKKLARILIEKYNGKVPKTREQLTSLPGVGRKTANLVLNRAFGFPAIAVDTHVHRITNILGWVKTKTPPQTEIALMKVLPQKYWSDANRLFVSLGRQYRSIPKLKQFLKDNQLID